MWLQLSFCSDQQDHDLCVRYGILPFAVNLPGIVSGHQPRLFALLQSTLPLLMVPLHPHCVMKTCNCGFKVRSIAGLAA